MKFDELKSFFDEHRMNSKGALCVGLVITRKAIQSGLPIQVESLMTEGHGQISLLGKSRVQKILGEYGITRVLAEEGGRTSRGSVGLSEAYADFLNDHNYAEDSLREIEKWWVDRVHDFFAGKPLSLKFDPSKSIRSIVHELIDLAGKRQAQNSGAQIVGAVLQHLVEAKMKLIIPSSDLPEIHGVSVADAPSGRNGDFACGDAVIHVTSAPGEAVIRKCASNIGIGLHPIIITVSRQVSVAEGLAETEGIANRLEVWDIEQFLSMNLNERGLFCQQGRKDMGLKLVKAYNEIIENCETDPSLMIDMGEK